jgi:hypothetical protein
MHRAQILLEEWQLEALRSAAEREGTSISGLVREIVSDYFARGREPAAESAGIASIAGLIDDPSASGRHHDRFLYRRGKEREPR